MSNTTEYTPGIAAPIRLRNLTKSFGGGRNAVDSLTLDIEAGQFVTFLGPSGCGKSTSLHMIAGLEKATSGSIEIGGRDVSTLPPQERDIAMVFQSYALYPHYTVRENIAFPLKAKRRKTSKEEIDRRVDYASSVLGLGDLLDRYPRELSGGQRQRVALGRATVRQPAAFLLDEPLSNLDLQLRIETRTELKELHQRLGATMVYVTHDQAEAMVLSDTVVLMRAGVVQQIGSPLDCYNNPANTFVATFLGEPGMNLIPGSVNGHRFEGPAGTVALDRALPASVGDVLLGVRPENLLIGPEGAEGLHAQVHGVEALGSRTLVRLQTGDRTIVASVPPSTTVQAGAAVSVRIADQEAIRLFRSSDGSAIADEPAAHLTHA